MMKNIISIICLLLSMCFVACHDDDSEEKGPQLAFSELIYTLDAEEPLKVEIRVTEPVSANTSVKFNVRGAAVQGEEYELSADEFVDKKVALVCSWRKGIQKSRVIQ